MQHYMQIGELSSLARISTVVRRYGKAVLHENTAELCAQMKQGIRDWFTTYSIIHYAPAIFADVDFVRYSS